MFLVILGMGRWICRGYTMVATQGSPSRRNEYSFLGAYHTILVVASRLLTTMSPNSQTSPFRCNRCQEHSMSSRTRRLTHLRPSQQNFQVQLGVHTGTWCHVAFSSFEFIVLWDSQIYKKQPYAPGRSSSPHPSVTLGGLQSTRNTLHPTPSNVFSKVHLQAMHPYSSSRCPSSPARCGVF